MPVLKIFTLITCFLLNACMVGPNYKEPQKPVAEHWPKKNRSVKETPFNNPKWWQVFHDPILTSLIYQGYHNNLTLKEAGVRVLQARAQLAQSVGELYPQQQQMVSSFTYYQIGGSELQSVLPSTFETDSFGFTANWEIDFWGKYRRAIQANDATFLSSFAAYDNALVTLTADIAKTYLNIRTYETQIKVALANIAVQRQGYNIARARYNAGQTNLIDVEQAQTELSQTQATIPPLRNSLEQEKNALAFLLGNLPNSVDAELKRGRGIPKAPSSVAVGIPKETLARRPDIHQARLEAIAQGSMIGAIKANLFPSLALNGSFAFASNTIGNNSLGDLFQWSNRTIQAGPNLSWNILNYGQITNQVRAQDAAFQQSLLKYVNVVLKAQQEVQTTIVAYIEAKNGERALSKANVSAVKTLKLAMIRYVEGETDFTPVLNAEQQQLKVQTSLVNAQAAIPLSLVGLYRALGGGWGIRGQDDIVPHEIKAEMANRTNWGGLLEQKNHMPARDTNEKIKELYVPTW